MNRKKQKNNEGEGFYCFQAVLFYDLKIKRFQAMTIPGQISGIT